MIVRDIGLMRKIQKDWTERLFDERPNAVKKDCAGCKRPMFLPPSKVNQRTYCTPSCKKVNPPTSHRKPEWGKRLFEERDNAIALKCETCDRTMWVPPSKSDRRYCTDKCQRAADEAIREAKKRQCLSCGKDIYPSDAKIARWHGKFCSQKCNAASGRLSSPENLAKAQDGKRRAIAEGRVKFPKGPANKQWMGGPKALAQRQIASGKAAEWLRRYRRGNKDKVREWSSVRKRKALGKLPKNSIAELRSKQRNRCAVCSTSLSKGYEKDHIMPLSKGGEHSILNIQLLCRSCNREKAAKDPIEFMQSKGKLL